MQFLDDKTSKIDTLIGKNRQLLDLVREKRKAIISESVTKGLDQGVQLRDSGLPWLGDLPAHWEIRRVRHLAAVLIGLTYDPMDIAPPGDGVLVLRASNIRRGRIVFGEDVFVATQIPDRLRTEKGDILICARSGSRALIGKSAIIDSDSEGHTFGAFMTILRSPINPFLFYALNSTVFEAQSASFLTSTINQLTVGDLRSLAVPIPPRDEQAAIVSYLNERLRDIDELDDKINLAIERLTQYRAALITASVAGQIDVPEVA